MTLALVVNDYRLVAALLVLGIVVMLADGWLANRRRDTRRSVLLREPRPYDFTKEEIDG